MINLVLASMLAAAPASTSSAAVGDEYFACPSGYAFQVKSSAARCYRAPRTISRAPEACLPGQNLRRDFQGTRDMCVTGVGVGSASFPPACPNGYRLTVRRGSDQCTGRRRRDIKAPSRKVNI
ncbi:MAG: hypothetical protein AAFR11_03875 [Pseudomonadota bacterium]